MTYINLPNQQSDLSVVINILYRDNQLWFQRITQVDDDKFDFIQVPLDRTFTSAVRKTVFPNQSNTYILDVEDTYGETVIEHYIVDRSDPPQRQDMPDEEVLVNLWIQTDGLEIMIYVGADDGINYLMDEAVILEVHRFITDILEDLKRQMMLLTSKVMETKACVEQVAGKPFQCCGQCEVCHCAV